MEKQFTLKSDLRKHIQDKKNEIQIRGVHVNNFLRKYILKETKRFEFRKMLIHFGFKHPYFPFIYTGHEWIWTRNTKNDSGHMNTFI